MWPWLSSRTVVIGTALGAFVVCCLLPVAYLLSEFLGRSADILSTTALDARRRGLLFNTVVLGASTALVATVVGAPLGIILARAGLQRAALLRVVLAAPALIPPYVMGLAWVYLGVLSTWTYSLPAAALVLSLVFYPLPMLATEVAMRRIDGRLEEAALMIAPPRQVLRRITLPLTAPSTVAAALLIFVLAVSEFGVPGLLRVRVYTTEVFTAFAALYDFSGALTLTVPILVACISVAAAAVMLVGDPLVTTPRSVSSRLALLGGWRRGGLALAVVVIVMALAAPTAVLVREAAGADSAVTVLSGSGTAIRNSLGLSAIGATLVVAVAVWLGYARSRASRRIGHSFDVVFVVLFAVPSTVVGVALIGLWNRPGLLGTVYGTDVMFLLAYLARFVPVAALMLAANARTVGISQEEASAVSGARWTRTIARIVLPQMRMGIATVWVIVFVLAFGELGVSILVAPPGEATLPIRIYTMIANTPPSHVALFALLQIVVIFTAVASLGLVSSLREAR
jgi:iron(III) transport system permease protein